jgi:hypothetical protein
MFNLPIYPYIRFRYHNSMTIYTNNKYRLSSKAYIENATSTKIIELFRKPVRYGNDIIYILNKYEDVKIAFSKGYLGVYLNSGNSNFRCLIIQKEYTDSNSPIIVDKNFYDLLKTKRKNRTLGERFLEKCFNDIINLAIIHNTEIIFQENVYLLNSGIDKLPNFTTLKEKKAFEESLYIGCQDLIKDEQSLEKS